MNVWWKLDTLKPEDLAVLALLSLVVLYFAAYFLWFFWLAFTQRPAAKVEADPDPHVAGRRLIKQDAAALQADTKRGESDPGLQWGGVRLPSAADELYFLVAGSIGSGKTKNLVALLRDIVPTITRGSDRRMVLFDPKNELYSVLHSLDPKSPIVSLNPADIRSHAMSFADILTPAAALHLASTLLPKPKNEQNSFFHDSVCNLMAGVFDYLIIEVPGQFNLRDAILILSSHHYLAQVVDYPHNRHLATVFEPLVTWQSIETTITSKLASLRILAAYWHHAKNTVNLRDWVSHQSSTLVLGDDAPIATTLSAFNRLFISRLSELVQAGPEGTPKRTFVVIDELPALGGDHPVHGLADMCHRGRSRGARAVIVFQTIEDLRRIYGPHGAQGLTGEFGNKLLLRTEDPAHAKWCSEIMGDYEAWEERISRTRSSQGESVTSSRERVRRPLVLPSEFMTIPPANPENGLTGYSLSPHIDGAWRFNIKGSWVKDNVPGAHPHVPAFIPRPAAHQYLPPFTDADLARLKLRRAPLLVT